MPDAPCSVCLVATLEALPYLRTQPLITQATLAARPHQPGIEATARDTEHLAYLIHRLGPSVLRNEAELHIDSLAKKGAAFSGCLAPS